MINTKCAHAGRRVLLSSSIATALAFSAQGPVLAQDASLEEVVVTGSRIQRSGGFDQPTPATVIGGQQVADLAIVNAGDIAELIPQNTAFVSDAVAGITAGADVGAAYANLRGLNPSLGTRTLTLVNTRRFVPTSDGGAVDLNLIPPLLLERTEEDDGVDALGLIPGEVHAIPSAPGLRVPHMGWNTLTDLADDPLLAGIEPGERAYFVHCYAAPPGPHTIASTTHGAPFSAVVRSGLRWGAQFHPERSASVGARLLRNFVVEVAR